MAFTGKASIHELINHHVDIRCIGDSAAKGDEVGVVVGFGHFGAVEIKQERTADSLDFICTNRDADSRAAKQNAEIIAAFFKFAARSHGHIRIIHRNRAGYSHIGHREIPAF